MPGSVLTYSPSDVIITLSGYQLGGVLSMELSWNSRPYTTHRGIRNVHTRVYNPSMPATLRVQIMQTSITNDVLSIILDEDRIGKSARLELPIKDASGKTFYQASQCYIPAYPNIRYSKGFETREWEIEILDLTAINIAGNSRAGFDITSAVNGAIDYLGDAASSAGKAVSSIF